MTSHLSFAVLLGTLTLTGGLAQAAPQSGKLTVDVRVTGKTVWTEGQDRATKTFTHVYHLVNPTVTDGKLDGVNNLDPAYLAKVKKLSAAVPTPAAPSQDQTARMKALGEKLQKQQAECKGNQACLMKLAMDAQSQMSAVMPAAPAPASLPEVEFEERYLHYFPKAGCKSDFTAVVQEKTEGVYGDVQGMVPYSITSDANMRATGTEAEMSCMAGQISTDEKTRTLFSHGLGWPGIKAKTVRIDGKRRSSADEEVKLPNEVAEFISAHFRKAAFSGKLRQAIKAKPESVKEGHTFGGEYIVELSWNFQSRIALSVPAS
jgi:hypothetical protein